MGIVRSIVDAVGGTFADQWKEVITAEPFDEYVVVSPGVLKSKSGDRGANTHGSDGILSDGSIILVPENTAAFIFSQGGIEDVITTAGGYEYRNGQDSVFDGNSIRKSILREANERVGFGGISPDEKRVAFVNLREIRNIRFGTRGPQVYHDKFYGVDLEIVAHGSFSVRVVDPQLFVRNFVPPSVLNCSFDDAETKMRLVAELTQSLVVVLNSLSADYRVSDILSQASELSWRIACDPLNAGTWKSRFGLQVVQVSVENVEFTDESRRLVQRFAEKKMSVTAYEGVSQRASDIAAQQTIAQGIEQNGLGDGGGMLFGMNFAQGLGTNARESAALPIDEQLDAIEKLGKLLESGMLTQEEFDAKKREILGL